MPKQVRKSADIFFALMAGVTSAMLASSHYFGISAPKSINETQPNAELALATDYERTPSSEHALKSASLPASEAERRDTRHQ